MKNHKLNYYQTCCWTGQTSSAQRVKLAASAPSRCWPVVGCCVSGAVSGFGLDYLPAAASSAASDTSWHQAGPTGSSWTNQESPMEESSSTVLLDSLKVRNMWRVGACLRVRKWCHRFYIYFNISTFLYLCLICSLLCVVWFGQMFQPYNTVWFCCSCCSVRRGSITRIWEEVICFKCSLCFLACSRSGRAPWCSRARRRWSSSSCSRNRSSSEVTAPWTRLTERQAEAALCVRTSTKPPPGETGGKKTEVWRRRAPIKMEN